MTDVKIKVKLKAFQAAIYDQRISEVNRVLQDTVDEFPDNEETIAMYCFISANVLSNKYFKKDSKTEMVESLCPELYQLCVNCCNILSQNWNSENTDFICCVYNFTRYFLAEEQIEYSLRITEYGIEFLNKVTRDLSTRERCSLKGLLSLYANNIDNFCASKTKNREKILRVWKLLFVISGYLNFEIMHKILLILNRFLLETCKNSPKDGYQFDCILIFIKTWNRVVDNAEQIYIDTALNSLFYAIETIAYNFSNFPQFRLKYSNLISEIKKIKFGNSSTTDERINLISLYAKILSLVYSVKFFDYFQIDDVMEDVKFCVDVLVENYVLQTRSDVNFSSFTTLLFVNCVNLMKLCYFANRFEDALEISRRSLSYFCLFPKSFLTSDPIYQLCVEKLVKCLCECYKKKNLHSECLRTVAAWVIQFSSCSNLMGEYGNIKSAMPKNLELASKTLFDILVTEKNIILEEWHIDLSDLNIDTFLLMELQLYEYLRFQSPEAVANIVARLETQKLDLQNQVKLYYYSVLFFTGNDEYFEYTDGMLPAIESLLNTLQKKYEEMKEDVKNEIPYAIQIANLYFVKFRLMAQSFRKSAEGEVIHLKRKPVRVEETEQGMESINGSCEILPAHTYLRYDKHLLVITQLNNSIDYWNYALKDVESLKQFVESMNNFKDRNNLFLEHITEAAFIYRLHYHLEKEICAWKLLYEVASILGDNESIFLALSNLSSVPFEVVNPEWESKLKELLPSAKPVMKTQYQLELLKRHLFSTETLHEASAIKNSIKLDLSKFELVVAKYLFMRSIFEYTVGAETSNPIFSALNAFSVMVHVAKTRHHEAIWQCYETQSLFLDISLYMGLCYMHIMQPREARCYLEHQMDVLQKLCIPIRTCQFLAALCRIDIMQCDFESCNFKLDNMEMIMQIQWNDKKQLPRQQLARKIKNVESGLGEIIRDIPQQLSLASPILQTRSKFVLPEPFTHKSSCLCNLCTNSEYQRLMFEIFLIKSIYFYLQKRRDEAIEHFKGTELIISKLMKRGSLKFASNIESLFLDILVQFYMQKSDFYASMDMLEEAKRYNSKAIKSLQQKYHSSLLHQELVEQKVAIEFAVAGKSQKPATQTKTIKKPRAKKLLSPILKTPQCGKSAVKNVLCESDLNTAFITPEPHKPQNARKLLFEDDDSTPVPVWKSTSKIGKTYQRKKDKENRVIRN